MPTARLTAKSVKNVLCPDGKRRTLFINESKVSRGTDNVRGYVQIKRVSVAGYARKNSRGDWLFFPHIDSRNIHLVRPASFAVGQRVRVGNTADVPTIYKGKVGIVELVMWNYLTPTYYIYINELVVVGTNNLQAP